MNQEAGKQQVYECAYHFTTAGILYVNYFDATGLVCSKSISWARRENDEITLIDRWQNIAVTYQVDKGILVNSQGDSFVRDKQWDFYGKWTSAYNEAGKIESDQYPYNTLNLIIWNNKNHIQISYITPEGRKRNCEYIWREFNGCLLYLYMDNEDFMLDYRFRYNFADRCFNLEISEFGDKDFNHFIGYTRNKPA